MDTGIVLDISSKNDKKYNIILHRKVRTADTKLLVHEELNHISFRNISFNPRVKKSDLLQ